ncbi:MAG: DUF5602 domain-containing protein [Armatimonadetes bacterium]|nr:DUF5602 domain-containing protein [Armatimonadota bacterium]
MSYMRAAALAALAACMVAPALGQAAPPSASAAGGTRVLLGQPQTVGAGTARTWVRLGADGRPAALGVLLSESALTGLPQTDTEYVLPLPAGADVSPFNHVGLNWNAHGHIPPGIYDRPHFDLHFYMITPADRDRITARGEDLARVRQAPPAAQAPEGYMPAPGAEEPRMGSHWVDPTSPEFHGRPFTQTFIYGFYGGQMVFAEPMVTQEYLLSRPDISEAVRQPAAYPKPGHYPAAYEVRYDPQQRAYSVSLEQLTLRP